MILYIKDVNDNMMKAEDGMNKTTILTGILHPPEAKTTCKDRDSPLSLASSYISNNCTSPQAQPEHPDILCFGFF